MMAAQRNGSSDSSTSRALHTVSGELLVQAPSDFSHTLAFMRGFTPMSGEQRFARNSVSRALMMDGRPVVLELAATRDPERLAYRLHADAGRPLSQDERVRALRRVRFQFGLDDDLAPFYALAEDEPAFSRVVTQLYGMHHVKFPTAFEIAVWAVLVQRTRMLQARKVKRALIERFGASLVVDDTEHWAFPEASTLAEAGPAMIAELVQEPKKAAAIFTLARAFTDAPEDFLRKAPFAQADAWLRALPMIGDFSATFILFRGLGRIERFAATSRELAAAVRRVYRVPNLSDAEALARGERYGSWKGYWALYLRASGFVGGVQTAM